MSEEEDGKLTYQAQSPDEEALLTAARNFGYVFLVSLNTIYVHGTWWFTFRLTAEISQVSV